ncbi:6584_t:CDS:2, partial [Acaulospora morrowiae]
LEQSIKEDAENKKLGDAELNTRIFELERSAKENEELRNRVVKLEQNQSIDTNAKSLDDEINSNDTSEQIISCNEESNTSNYDIYQDSVTSTSPAETMSFASQSDLCRLEEKIENEFLHLKHREAVRKEIIQNIKEKKLRDQELLSTPENTIPNISISLNKNVSIPEAEKSLLNKDLNIQDTKLSSSESKSFIISSSNQKQNLSNPIPDRQILENMLDGDGLVNEQTGCQKVIGVKNLHARVTEPSKSTTKLSRTSNSEDIISEDDKSLSNTSVSISNTEVSPNNTTHIFNSANVDEIGELLHMGNRVGWRSRAIERYFKEFRTRFWERLEHKYSTKKDVVTIPPLPSHEEFSSPKIFSRSKGKIPASQDPHEI